MKDVIQTKLDQYQSSTTEDEENALKEITQEVALYALAKSGFFSKACFQGGTCLRILYGLDRFSEDLDFCLKEPDLNFNLTDYLTKVTKIMADYGYNIDVVGKDQEANNVKMRFLKDNSIKKILKFEHGLDQRRKIKIKVEIDINPPGDAHSQQVFIDFPLDFSIVAHDLPSLFAGKCHALLSRDYTKGRDWYDFSWYVARGTQLNYKFFANALRQTGPWSSQDQLKVDEKWLKNTLTERVKQIDWPAAIVDVRRFLPANRQASLELWGVEFFLAKIAKMFRQS